MMESMRMVGHFTKELCLKIRRRGGGGDGRGWGGVFGRRPGTEHLHVNMIFLIVLPALTDGLILALLNCEVCAILYLEQFPS